MVKIGINSEYLKNIMIKYAKQSKVINTVLYK